jgi:hypothetical protein
MAKFAEGHSKGGNGISSRSEIDARMASNGYGKVGDNLYKKGSDYFVIEKLPLSTEETKEFLTNIGASIPEQGDTD